MAFLNYRQLDFVDKLTEDYCRIFALDYFSFFEYYLLHNDDDEVKGISFECFNDGVSIEIVWFFFGPVKPRLGLAEYVVLCWRGFKVDDNLLLFSISLKHSYDEVVLRFRR